MSERYEHDHCAGCRFVCQAGEYDVWICHFEDSVIARFDNHPADYMSMHRPFLNVMFDSKSEDVQRLVKEEEYYKIWKILYNNPDWQPLTEDKMTYETISQLLAEKFNEYRGEDKNTPLDGDDVDSMINGLKIFINYQQGNITEEEYKEQMYIYEENPYA